LKIAISGSQGTGKSFTVFKLANQMKLKYPDKEVTILNETARKCPYTINEGATVSSQLWMISNQIQREIEAENNCDIVICDRCISDYFAYTFLTSFDLYNSLFSFLRFHIKTYDMIIFKSLKNNNDYLVDDGKRSVNKIYQKKIDNILREIYEELEQHINKLEVI